MFYESHAKNASLADVTVRTRLSNRVLGVRKWSSQTVDKFKHANVWTASTVY